LELRQQITQLLLHSIG